MDINTSLSVLFVNFYNSKKEEGIVFIPDTEVALIIMIGLYDKLINENNLVPIEYLSVEDKIELTEECRKMNGVAYTNKTLIEHCKILHLIKTINNYS